MLVVPVGACLVAIAYRFAMGEPLDRTGWLLCAGMVAVLAVREAVAAVDVRRYAHRMAEQEARTRALVAGASDVTVVLGDDLVVRWQSPAGPRRFGLPDDEVVGRRFTDLLHPDDAAAVADRLRAVTAGPPDPAGGTPPLLEARILDGFGRYRETESTVSDLRDAPEVAALVLNIRDVGERRRLERAVARLTSTDQLTGLPNRREVVRAVAGRRRGGRRPGALIVIELLDLAGINDRYGSRVGDAVLVEVGVAAAHARRCGGRGRPAGRWAVRRGDRRRADRGVRAGGPPADRAQ